MHQVAVSGFDGGTLISVEEPMRPHPTIPVLLVALVALASCASDDPPTASKEAATTTTSVETTEAAPTPTAFCKAKAAFDAVDSDTPDEAAFDRYIEEATEAANAIADDAPPELAEAASTLVDTLAGLETLDQGTTAHADPAYAKARADLATAVDEGCGYGRIALTIDGDSYADPPSAAKAGLTSLLVDNGDEQVRVTIVAKLADGTTGQQVLENPDLFETSATPVGIVVAGPESVDGTILDLSPGEYIYFDPEHLEDGMAASLAVAP